jgi:hypothetical protein
MHGLQYKQPLSLEVENVAKETDKTVVKKHSHPNNQSSDREDVEEKDVSQKKKETRKIGVDESELETFWRYYIA